jgi:hypothetical protein
MKLSRPGRLFCLLSALVCGTAFVLIAYKALGVAHPADDAYILFRYADHIAAGHGIVFNIGGPHAEGATDFLWLVLLSGGVWLGVDVAITALILNAIGAGIAAWVLARLCWGSEDRSVAARVLFAFVLPSVFLVGGAPAGYWGFSSMLYSALILLLFATAVESRGPSVALIPLLGLTVALFRPDGVIVGVPFVLLGLWKAWSERVLRIYLLTAAACGAVGLTYAAWRWSYFGLPLPLPLYVKQNSAATAGWSAMLPGMRDNWAWLVDPEGPRFVVLGVVTLLLGIRFWRDRLITQMVAFAIPVGLLLMALAFAVQSQNVAFRFQAPAHLVLLYTLLALAGTLASSRSLGRWAALGLVVAAATPPMMAGLRAIDLHLKGSWRTYIEAFAPRFGPAMDATTVIALTEAGVVPYWTKAQVIDVVGLNYPAAAVRPLTVADVQTLKPDFVFLHQADSLMNEVLTASLDKRERVHSLTPDDLRRALHPSRRAVLERHSTSYDDIGLLNVQYAATVLIQYLIESDAYEVVLVDPFGHQFYTHVWGVRKDWPLREEALRSLRWSLEPGSYRSYLDARRARHGGRAATIGAF